MHRFLFTIPFLCLATALADDVLPPTGSTIVPEGAKLELLFTRTAKIQGGLTEGPAAAPDGSIYFSDIPLGGDNGLIMRFDPKTKKTSVFVTNSGKSNGLKFDGQGRLIACEGADGGRRAVSMYTKDESRVTRRYLAVAYQGKRFNAPNDLVIDRKGRIYFSDPRYLGDEPRELEHRAVYRINEDRSVVEVTHDVEKPNGVALSPDEKTLYVVDHNNGTDKIDPNAPPPKKGAMKLYAFSLGDDGLPTGKRRTLIDLGNENGFDGLTVDRDGNLYLAQRSLKRPGILVTDANGQEIAFIPTGPSQPGTKEPKGIPSNCCFGAGEEKSTLYVTIDVSLYRIRLKIPGHKAPWEK